MANIIRGIDNLNAFLESKVTYIGGTFEFSCSLVDCEGTQDINIDVDRCRFVPDDMTGWITPTYSNGTLSLEIDSYDAHSTDKRYCHIPVSVNGNQCSEITVKQSASLPLTCDDIREYKIEGKFEIKIGDDENYRRTFSVDGETAGTRIATYQIDAVYEGQLHAILVDADNNTYRVSCADGNIVLIDAIPSNIIEGHDTDIKNFYLRLYGHDETTLCDSLNITQDSNVICPNCDNFMEFLFKEYEIVEDEGVEYARIDFPLTGTGGNVLLFSATTKGCGTLFTTIEGNEMFDGNSVTIEYDDVDRKTKVYVYGSIVEYTGGNPWVSSGGKIEYTSNDGLVCNGNIKIFQTTICDCEEFNKQYFLSSKYGGITTDFITGQMTYYSCRYFPSIFYNRGDGTLQPDTQENVCILYYFKTNNVNKCSSGVYKVVIDKNDVEYELIEINYSDGTYNSVEDSVGGWLSFDSVDTVLDRRISFNLVGTLAKNTTNYGRLAKIKVQTYYNKKDNWIECESNVFECYQMPKIDFTCDDIKAIFSKFIYGGFCELDGDITANPEGSDYLFSKTETKNTSISSQFQISLPILFGEIGVVVDECAEYSGHHEYGYNMFGRSLREEIIGIETYVFNLKDECSESKIGFKIKISDEPLSECNLLEYTIKREEVECECDKLTGGMEEVLINAIDFEYERDVTVASSHASCLYEITECYLCEGDGTAKDDYDWVELTEYSVHTGYSNYYQAKLIFNDSIFSKEIGTRAFIKMRLKKDDLECEKISYVELNKTCGDYFSNIITYELNNPIDMYPNTSGNPVELGTIEITNSNYYINGFENTVTVDASSEQTDMYKIGWVENISYNPTNNKITGKIMTRLLKWPENESGTDFKTFNVQTICFCHSCITVDENDGAINFVFHSN